MAVVAIHTDRSHPVASQGSMLGQAGLFAQRQRSRWRDNN